MHRYFTISIKLVVGILLAALSVTVAHADQDAHKQAALVGAELSTIARHLSERPNTAIDFTDVSNEHCFFTGWDKHHTHYAIDPGATKEDTIDFVDARPLIETGMSVKDLPAAPAELGQMTPGQWYLVAEGQKEPHHGMTAKFPLMVRATNKSSTVVVKAIPAAALAVTPPRLVRRPRRSLRAWPLY